MNKSTGPVTPTNPVAKAIWDDINGRRGFDLSTLDEDIAEDMADTWDRIANEAMGGDQDD